MRTKELRILWLDGLHRNSYSETVLKWRRANDANNGGRALQAKRRPSEKAMK